MSTIFAVSSACCLTRLSTATAWAISVKLSTPWARPSCGSAAVMRAAVVESGAKGRRTYETQNEMAVL